MPDLLTCTSSPNADRVRVEVVRHRDTSSHVLGTLGPDGRLWRNATLPNPTSDTVEFSKCLLRMGDMPESFVAEICEEFRPSVGDLVEQGVWQVDPERIIQYVSRRGLGSYVEPPILGLPPQEFRLNSPQGAFVISRTREGFEIEAPIDRSSIKASSPLEASRSMLKLYPLVTRGRHALEPVLAQYVEERVGQSVTLDASKIALWATIQLRGLDVDMRPRPPSRGEVLQGPGSSREH